MLRHLPGAAVLVGGAGRICEALASPDSNPEPWCLILDLMLPDGDGMAVLEGVRAKSLKTRVAVCTGTVNLIRLKAAAELRPDVMLPRPICLPGVWTEPCRVHDGRKCSRERFSNK